jgi:2-(1,2-epoxy-1,2-dihydrophenyl)acetyl-CoA isomerase
MSPDPVRIARDPEVPHTAWLILDRPEARNAWSDPMLDAFVEAIDELDADEDVRVVILTGAGPAFSAGGDLKAMRDHTGMFQGDPATLRGRYLRGIHRVPRRLARFDKPVIAAINGPAIGAGLDLACMCDVRVLARGARLGSTFVRLGLVPGDGGAYFLARTIGLPRALDLVLTGRLVDADEALSLGLVHQVVAPEDLTAAARDRARVLAANAPQAVQLAKRAAYAAWDLPLHAALEMAATYQGIVQNTPDHDEGVAALLERRPPRFGPDPSEG